MVIELETERLLLRRFTEEDAGRLLALDADPEVMRYIGPFALPDLQAYRDLLTRRWVPYYELHPGWGFWAAVERGGDFLGWFHLRPALDYRFAKEAGYRSGDVDLGYRFLRRAWGRGFATEGSRALVGKAFAQGADRVVAVALSANLASRRVLEKAGLKREQVITLPGFDEPAEVYSLSREDYSPPEG